jgi:hypothetical protein
VKRRTATVSAGTVTSSIASSSGTGSDSMVLSVGMKNRITHSPSAPARCDTGAVIAICWPRTLVGCCATGAVIAIFAASWFAPNMYRARRRKPSLRAASSLAATAVSAAIRGP